MTIKGLFVPRFVWENLDIFFYSILAAIISIVLIRNYARKLQENLVEFMRRWKPVVERYGWLFIELHTVPSHIIARKPHRTPTVAYDLTHGFTNQYPVERSELLAAAGEANLRLGTDKLQATFPSEEFTRISMTYLRGA